MAEITVQKGDSLWKIAKRVKPAGVSTDAFVKQMIAANPELADPDKIQSGMVLQAPGAKEPPTPRMDPRGAPGPRGHQAPMPRVPRAPADIVRGVEPVANEVIVGRDGEIRARAGTEQLGPGSGLDRAAAMVEIARRQELTRRAAVQQERSLAQVLRDRGYSNVTVMHPWTVDPSLAKEPAEPGPLEGGPLLQRNPETDYEREAAVTLPPPKDIYMKRAMEMPSAGDRGNYTLGDPGGLLEEGTVNLAERPRVPNPDGTFSTVRSKSFEIDGKEVLVPTMGPDGAQLTDDEAVNRFLDTGEHLGVFKSPEAATAYAKRLSLGLGGPTHDPDAFIDMGSPRWREVFVEGNLAAVEANRQRRAVSGPPPLRAKVRVPTSPTTESLGQLETFMGRAGQVGAMGGKNVLK